MANLRVTEPEAVLERITSRGKTGMSSFSRRKPLKITNEADLSPTELQWCKDYAAVLKAVSYSYRYISDTLNIQTGIVKSWFEEKDVQEKVAVVQADIVSGAVTHLRHHSVELVEMLLELARRTVDDSVKLRAITEGLDRVGISKVNKSESVVTKTEKSEAVLSQELFEKMEALPLETQSKLAAMAAEMEKVMAEAGGTE